MWRGRSRYFSTYSSPAPNAFNASLAAASKADSISPASWMSRIPLPPPPATALRSTGSPSRSASLFACTWSATGRVEPGTIGTPAACMRRRASVLSPIARMAVAGGPMKVSPASATASANGARSEKKPYPGWTAWQSVARAASRSLATSKYDSAAGGAPIGTARWAARTWGESRSASEYTATDSSPSSWQARMMRSAISPRFATRTRVNEAIRRQTSDVSTSAARDLFRQPERLQRLAQRRCGAGGAGVQRQGGLGPRVVVVEREAQRGEHEVARRHAVVLQVRARHPEQRPRGPADARPGRPVERHGHADRAPLRQLGERRVRVAMAAELQVGGDAPPQHGVRPPRRERHGQQVGAQPARELPRCPRGRGAAGRARRRPALGTAGPAAAMRGRRSSRGPDARAGPGANPPACRSPAPAPPPAPGAAPRAPAC